MTEERFFKVCSNSQNIPTSFVKKNVFNSNSRCDESSRHYDYEFSLCLFCAFVVRFTEDLEKPESDDEHTYYNAMRQLGCKMH